MVAHLHDAGLEVILDVVYNHTAEGNERGPTLSFKGIDNASYYRLPPDARRYYINDTGTGNTVNLSHPRVLQMVTDSLRYWATEMHVDGFRFDLATILGREPYGFDEGGGFLDTCRQDPVLSQVKLIAEPWDCGPGGYQVGSFSPGWAEWNDRYRDTARSYWRGDEGKVPELASRLAGSADLFNKRGRRPWASVNFVTAHDGFTLNDLVSYNDKHNEANGEDNRDGSSNNLSWNCGVEGPTDDPAIRALRERQKRNFLTTLLLSQGTPMILAGDEWGHTQQGNNNAYCQDNEVSWLEWDAIGDEGRALTAFVRKLTMLRHAFPILRRGRFLTADWNEELQVKEVTWINAAGTEMEEGQWADGNMRCFGMLLDGRARETGIKRPGSDATLLLCLNAHSDVVNFTLPPFADGTRWLCLIDTNDRRPRGPPLLQDGRGVRDHQPLRPAVRGPHRRRGRAGGAPDRARAVARRRHHHLSADQPGALEEGPKLAHVLHALEREHGVDELRALRLAEPRRHQVARLGGDLGARHGILRRAAHVLDPLAHLRAVGERQLDDALAPRADRVDPRVGEQLDLGALAQHGRVLHARRCRAPRRTRRSCRAASPRPCAAGRCRGSRGCSPCGPRRSPCAPPPSAPRRH